MTTNNKSQQPAAADDDIDELVLLEVLRCVNDATSVPKSELNDIANNTHGRIMEAIRTKYISRERIYDVLGDSPHNRGCERNLICHCGASKYNQVVGSLRRELGLEGDHA